MRRFEFHDARLDQVKISSGHAVLRFSHGSVFEPVEGGVDERYEVWSHELELRLDGVTSFLFESPSGVDFAPDDVVWEGYAILGDTRAALLVLDVDFDLSALELVFGAAGATCRVACARGKCISVRRNAKLDSWVGPLQS